MVYIIIEIQTMTATQVSLIPYETRKSLYQTQQYEFPVPPVCTYLWNEEDWIKYIDESGKWITPIANQIESENPYDKSIKDCGFYNWLIKHNSEIHEFLNDVTSYLESFGWVKFRDLLNSNTVKCLRYQHDSWIRRIWL